MVPGPFNALSAFGFHKLKGFTHGLRTGEQRGQAQVGRDVGGDVGSCLCGKRDMGGGGVLPFGLEPCLCRVRNAPCTMVPSQFSHQLKSSGVGGQKKPQGAPTL